MRPCAVIYREQPDTAWEPFDFALAEAFTMMEKEVCGSCGNPVWLCRSTDRNLQFKVETHTCRATQALEAHKDKLKDSDSRASSKEKRGWGKFYAAVPATVMPDTELPSRSDFFKGDKIEGKER